MKILTLTLLLVIICSFGFTQIPNRDSLKRILETTKLDSIKFKTLTELSNYYRIRYPDTSIVYANKALEMAKKSKDIRKIGYSQNLLSRVLTYTGNYPLALNYAYESQKIYEILKDTVGMMNGNLAVCFKEQGDTQNALKYILKSIELSNQYYSSHKDKIRYQIGHYSVLSSIYEKNNQLDLAIAYADTVLKFGNGRFQSAMMYILGSCYSKKKQYEKAMDYYKKVIPRATKLEYHKDLIEANTGIAVIFKEKKQLDSAIYYCQKALGNPYGKLIPKYQLEASSMIASIYESQHRTDSALKYLKQTIAIKDTLFNQEKVSKLEQLKYEETEREHRIQRRVESMEIAFQNKIKYFILLAILLVLGAFTFILYRNNRKKHQTNTILQDKNKEIESTLSTLKATQNQLIQSEKLASLGELTAGIAHEIQNPLNFVNNFSEVSNELIQEIKEERKKPKERQDEELIDEIFGDISQNLEKISSHGKRASSIVKGMLDHSKNSSGKKQLTDINVLADEYLRLAYHGLRAKNKDFNSDFRTELDPNLQKIAVIPQDIGRVLLNLINNAFYAAKSVNKPLVVVSTKKTDNQVVISVKDNGIGMSHETKAKIFQPFFTTKPTGEGTGLGLSLAYDIVTKGHGGTLEVETKEGEGTTFIIQLPITIA